MQGELDFDPQAKYKDNPRPPILRGATEGRQVAGQTEMECPRRKQWG